MVTKAQPFTTNEEAWAAAASWGTERRMNEIEALMWRSERHPRLSSTITGVEVLATQPEWTRFSAAHEWGARLVPRFRQRVVEPPLSIGPPVWTDDADFDLAYHLRRVTLPAPGTM